MRVPANVAELKQIIMTMSHRERFTYPVTSELRKRFQCADSVEIYCTTLFESKYCDKNINIKLVAIDGTMINHDGGLCKGTDKPVLNKSKYIRLMDDNYFESIYTIISQGNIDLGMIEIAGNGSPVIR